MLTTDRRDSALLCLAITIAANAPAQCTATWQPLAAVPGIDGDVYATTAWDPDGVGPAGPRIVFGGRFQVAGSVTTSGVAAFDPANGTWHDCGGGVTGTVNGPVVFALATLPGGDLVAAGLFAAAGGQAANCVARWNGSTWQPFGGGITNGGGVYALAVLQNGDLVAGGQFQTAGGQPAAGIARWNGTAWQSLGSGIVNGNSIHALNVQANGMLVVGGNFTNVGGVQTYGVARWTGTTWQALGSLTASSGVVFALATRATGELLAAGSFTIGSGAAASHIAILSGASWQPFATQLSSIYGITALLPQPNGDVVAGGLATTIPATSLGRWNGSQWLPFGTGVGGNVHTLCALGTDLYVGGAFDVAGGVDARRVARWNGVVWSPVSPGTGGYVFHALARANGDIVISGDFHAIEGVPCNHIASFDGTNWHALGTGFDNFGYQTVELPGGDLIALGAFTQAGGVAVQGSARWNGTAWSAFAVPAFTARLLVRANGELIAAAFDGVYRLLGGTWQRLGGIPSDGVFNLAELPNGELVAGGAFFWFDGWARRVARWDGMAWQALGVGLNGMPNVLLPLPDGSLVTCGLMLPDPAVQRWDGSAWQAVGNLPVTADALLQLPDGDLLAGGGYWSSSLQGVARWNGTTWSSVAGGVQTSIGGVVGSLVHRPGGEVFVGGSFSAVGGQPAANLALLLPGCPPAATTTTAGCPGGGTLTAATLPWIGTNFVATVTGLPTSGFAVEVLGFTAINQPLSALLPQAVPGCTLGAAPDVLYLHLPVAGAATGGFAVPGNPAVVGVQLHQQFVALATAATGDIVTATASNALQLTVGAF